MKHRQTSKQLRAFTRLGGLFATAAIVLAACGGGGGKPAAADGMAGMAMPPQRSAGAGTLAPVAADAVQIKNFAFSPATITVKAGATVVWTNDDSVQHEISFEGGDVNSTVLNHNDTFSHPFPTAGTYHYICSIHPFMHATVIVSP